MRLPPTAAVAYRVRSRAHPCCAEADSPQNEPLPGEWEAKVTPFQRLLVLKIFRPEKVVFACNEFVGIEMGDFFKEAPRQHALYLACGRTET